MRLPQLPFLHHDPPEWKTAAEEAAEREAKGPDGDGRQRMKRERMRRRAAVRSKKSSEAERAIVIGIGVIVAVLVVQAVLTWVFGLPGLSVVVGWWQAIGEHWQDTPVAP
jgi:hypothetical protein